MRAQMPTPTFLDRVVAVVSPERANRRMIARMRLQMAEQFRGASMSRLRNNWVMPLDSATPDLYELETLRDRCRDLNRNDPVASGATETMGLNIVGRGLKPQSRIRAEYLGVTEERARELIRQAELIWQEWTPRADAGNRLNFDEIQFVALRKIIEDGETLALPVMGTESWRSIKRCVELIEADRLQGDTIDGTGIKKGKRGEPVSYSIRKADSTDTVNISAFDKNGRPKILHVFHTKRPGQSRGYPFFAPVVGYFKDLADYLEAEVVAARVAACLAVFVTKQDAYTTAYNISTDTDASGNRIQEIEPGLVGYLEPGEGINVVDPKRPGDTFPSFVETILRHIGIALNMPYEILVKDFSKTNYSSARAALLEGRRMFTTWRNWFSAKFCQPIYDLVLEEAYLRGLFDAPDFYKNRSEYTRAAWIGGGWGWVDPVKEVEASRKAIDYGLSTLAEEAAGQGRDWEEVLEQIRREQEKVDMLGVKVSRSGSKQEQGDTDNANSSKQRE